MMLEPGPVIVVLVYAGTLALVHLLPRRFTDRGEGASPWWRNIRFWASVVILLQMAVYAVWG